MPDVLAPYVCAGVDAGVAVTRLAAQGVPGVLWCGPAQACDTILPRVEAALSAVAGAAPVVLSSAGSTFDPEHLRNAFARRGSVVVDEVEFMRAVEIRDLLAAARSGRQQGRRLVLLARAHFPPRPPTCRPWST